MNHCIILAGGSGTRFWPLSRNDTPKQFLNICTDKPMIEETIKRIGPLIDKRNIYIATSKLYHKKIKLCLKGLGVPKDKILFEPKPLNTLAPIGLLSKNIYEKDKQAIVFVLPCDHYVKQEKKFINVLKQAVNCAKADYIVTLGIVADGPETGYGYIKVKEKGKSQKAKVKSEKFFEVERFIEKPTLENAKKFVKDKRYYWNGGIFVFKASVMLDEIKRLSPKDYQIIQSIKNDKILNSLWHKFSPLSIDYAVMEKTSRAAVVPADIGWMDMGSWKAYESLAKKDRCGNVLQGNCIDLGSSNTLVFSDRRLLATIGLEGLIIVDTKDALLICSKEKTQDVKKIVQILKEKKLHSHL